MTALRPERDSGSTYGGADDHGLGYGQEWGGEPPSDGGTPAHGAMTSYDEAPLYDGTPAYGTTSAHDVTSARDVTSAYDATPAYDETVVLKGVKSASDPGDETVVLPGAALGPVLDDGPVPDDRPVLGDETVVLNGAAVTPVPDDETVALRISAPSPSEGAPARASDGPEGPDGGSGRAPVTGGRAARRKAAKGRQSRRGRHGAHAAHTASGSASAGDGAAGPEAAGRPLSRVEARRAARASKPDPSVVVSRAAGEVFITVGVLMLLFVTYQLWWTNVAAHNRAGNEAHKLQDDWAKGGKRDPGEFAPGQGFAMLDIPKLDVAVPIAEGINKEKVLDQGMVGHYGEDSVPTAMPGDKTGNVGLAAHRNTHGEPFRYINKLKPGDPVVVETRDTYYVYEVTSMLPQTPPSNTSVLDPVPPGSGFTKPGRYITLTTCTPEFTSKYRLIVWGRMTEERPRDKGKPDALVE